MDKNIGHYFCTAASCPMCWMHKCREAQDVRERPKGEQQDAANEYFMGYRTDNRATHNAVVTLLNPKFSIPYTLRLSQGVKSPHPFFLITSTQKHSYEKNSPICTAANLLRTTELRGQF
jgi:hypothetical protein